MSKTTMKKMTTDKEWEKAEKDANNLLGLNHSNEIYLGEGRYHYLTYQWLYCELFYPLVRFEHLADERLTDKEIDELSIKRDKQRDALYDAIKKLDLPPIQMTIL